MDTLLKKKALTYVHPTSMSNNTEKINQIIQKIIQTIKPINQNLYLSSLLTILDRTISNNTPFSTDVRLRNLYKTTLTTRRRKKKRIKRT